LTKKALPNWLVVLIFVVGVALGFGGFWLGWRYMNKEKQPVKIPAPIANNDNQPPGDVSLPTSTEQVTDQNSPSKNSYADYALAPVMDSMILDVDWNSAPKSIDPKLVYGGVIEANNAANVYPYDQLEKLQSALTGLSVAFDSPADDQALGTWELGKVAEGKYKDYRVFEQRDGMCDLGGCADFRFILSPDGKRALTLGTLWIEQMKAYRTPPASDNSGRAYEKYPAIEWEKVLTPAFYLSLKGTNEQPELTYKGKELEVSGYLGWDTVYMDWLKMGGKMTGYKLYGKTDNGYPIYAQEEMMKAGYGCLNVQVSDKRFIRVASKLKVKNPEGYEDADRAIDITWDSQALNGKNPSKTYMVTSGGCETFCPTLAASGENVSLAALTKVGTVNGGDPIYIPTDPEQSPTVLAAYESWFLPDGKSKPNFEEFLKQIPVPIFLWQDAFGRWVRYADIVLSPPAECGKPVIYLYPKETTNVSVALPRFVNVTVSEPRYPVGGWKVMARPDGTLNLLAASSTYATTTYGSLYWEGTGIGYVTPKDGFLVKNGEQKAFLSNILLKYGLNKKEAGEFMDFWLPKMTGAPYYRVSFLTSTWSQAAPLYVNPKPETSIRIFMDWQKLSTPIKITPPQIVTPARNGFTLVEWGGLLYK